MTSGCIGTGSYPVRHRRLVRVLIVSVVDAVRLTVWCQVLGLAVWAGFDWPAVQHFVRWVFSADQELVQSALTLQAVWICTLSLWMMGRRLGEAAFPSHLREVSIP